MNRILLSILAAALVMGPGPGIYLINDAAREGGTLAGVPILYGWAVFWCAVMAGCVAGLYWCVWRKEGDR